MHVLRLVAFFLLAVLSSEGSVAQTYLKVIGDPGRNESGFVAHRSPADELYIAGSVNDSAFVQRIDADGNVLWSRSFKPPGQFAKNVVHLSSAPDGSLLGCGTGYGAAGDPVEGFHFRMTNAGAMLWVRYWDDPQIYERRIQALSATEYIMFGGYFDATALNYSDILTARIDAATGDVVWLSGRLDQYSPVPYISDMGSMVTIGNSHYAACSIFTNGSALSTRRVGLSKFDLTGQHLNTDYLLYSNVDNRRMVTPDIIATNDSLTMAYFGDINGASTNFTQGLIRMDTLGNVAWARDFNVGGSGQEMSTKVISTSFGYLVAGRTTLTVPQRFFLMAISNTGVHLWTKSYGPPTQAQTVVNLFASNLIDVGNGFLLTGTVVQASGDRDILLIRTDVNGNIDCSDVNNLSAVTTILPILKFPSPTQETAFAAGLGPTPIDVVDAQINDVCVLTVDLGNDTTLCGTIILDANVPGATYEWQDGSTDQTFDVSVSGTYWVRVSMDCCVASDTVEVNLGMLADIDLGPDTAICANDLLFLEPAQGPWNYEWQDGSADPNFIVFGPGTYWVEVTDGGCIARDTIIVSTFALPTVQLGADTASCTGVELLLDPMVTDATEYLWSDASTADSLVVATTGTYWLQVGNYCGFSSDTVLVTIADAVTVDLGPDTLLCTGTVIPLNVVPMNYAVQWSDMSTGNTFNITTGGTYWVDLINGQCVVTDSIVVQELEVPDVIMPADTILCNAATFLIVPDVTGAADLLWSDGSSGPNLLATTTDVYVLEATNICGTTADSVSVTLISTLAVGLGPDTLMCEPDSLLLDLSDVDGTLLWSDGSQGTSLLIDLPGTYWVEGDILGCIARDTIVVTYSHVPVLDLGPDTVLCEETEFTLDAGIDGEFTVWSDGSVGPELVVTRAGVYRAQITNTCGQAMDTVRVRFKLPVARLEEVALCPGRKVTLRPQGQLLETIWSTGDTVPAISVGEGEYGYIATDIVGCSHSDSTRVYIDSSLDGLVFIPNAFTPNDDGFNEVFMVAGPERGEFELAIFDRWGGELFRTDDPYKGWDGTTAGSGLLPSSVYVYVVTYRDRCDANFVSVTRRGHVTLLH